MKILCFGNTTSNTDELVTELAHANNSVNRGLVHKASDITYDGYYHTTVVDMSDVEIEKLNCKFILLEQSKQSYNTLNEYNKTKKIVEKNNYWENLLDDNNSFCIFPFINHSLMQENTTLCCRSKTKVAENKDFDWATNDNMQSIRNKMLQGEQLSNCDWCYRQEEQNVISDRKIQTIDWTTRLGLKSLDDLNFENPVMYDIFPDTKCNLMCRMCSPEYSVLIEREYKKLGIWEQPPIQKTNWDIIDIEHAQVVYIAGGEPTAMPEFFQFLEQCKELNRTDLEIRINTNANKMSNRLFDLLSDFANIHFTVSIDGYELSNDYSRWLSNWDNIDSNIKKIVSQRHSINFNVTVSIYTIFSLHNLLDYLDTNCKNTDIHICYAVSKNNILDPYQFVYDRDTLENFELIKNTDIYNNNSNVQSFVNSLIIQANNSVLNTGQLIQFFEFNDLLDTSRNVKLQDYIPKLAAKRQLIGDPNG